MLFDLLRQWWKPNLQSLNTIYVDAALLRKNYSYLQWLHPDNGIFPVVKSNAYWHWIAHVVKALTCFCPPYICVDSFPEYQIVKKYASSKVLVLWETFPDNYRYYNRNTTTFCVWSLHLLRYFIDAWKRVTLHLFLNTWMNREWMQRPQLREAVRLLQNAPYITVEWVMSHFANADEVDRSFCDNQYEQFVAMGQYVEDHCGELLWKHIWNSASCLVDQYEYCTAWRSWLALYWYSPFASVDDWAENALRPALSVESTIISIQDLEVWDWVSYGQTWSADSPVRVASLAFGYAEWLRRSLSDSGWLIQWHDQFFPLVGRVCMNLSTICVDTQSVRVWDRVTLFSADPHAPNSIAAYARAVGSIPYEVLVWFSPHVRRVLV